MRADQLRLVQLAHLWNMVKFRHPGLTDNTVDWDKALVEALPSIEAARTDTELTSALIQLMQPLNDPALRVYQPAASYVQWEGQGDDVEPLGPRTVLLHLHAGSAHTERYAVDPAAREQLRVRLQGVDAIVIDVRPVRPGAPPVDHALSRLLRDLIDRPITLPSEQLRFQADLDAPNHDNSDGLLSGLLTLAAERLSPSGQGRAVKLAFVVDEDSVVPKAVTALHNDGRAAVVSEGGRYRNRVVGVDAAVVSAVTVEYSHGYLVGPSGVLALKPDLLVPRSVRTGPDSDAVRAAARLLAAPLAAPPSSGMAPVPVPVLVDEPPYKEMQPLPEYGWRILAAIKLWSTMETYFPYKSLTDSSWEAALAACLEEMRSVNSAETYAIALARMAAKLDDSHVRVFSRGMRAFLGEASVGVTLQMVEGKIVVTAVHDVRLAGAGMKVGDELVTIDGEKVNTRIDRLMPVISGSTRAAKTRDALRLLLNGASGSVARLAVVRPGRSTLRIGATRVRPSGPEVAARAGRPVFEILPGNIGYVDLDRLDPDQVDPMFDALRGTRALIFDMRGYPHGTAWKIAPRINVRHAQTGAIFSHSLVTAQPASQGFALTYAQPISVSDRPLYRGKIAMLINEETQSQAEHTGLLFEAAAPVTFVGSASAGTDGDIRNVALPGGVFVSFSGYAVRHADGRQLQRIGLQPTIVAAPTLKGVRRGDDEVLQRALRFLRQRPAAGKNGRM